MDICAEGKDLVPVFVHRVVDPRCVGKPLGAEALLLGAVSGVGAAVQGALGESWCLLDTSFSLCKSLSTGLSGVLHTKCCLSKYGSIP